MFFFFIIIVTTSGNYFHICCFFFPVSASSLSSDFSYNLQSWGMFLKLGHKESEWNCNAEIGKHVCGSTSVYNQYFLEIIRWICSSSALRSLKVHFSVLFICPSARRFPSGVDEISQSESKYCCFHQVDTNTTQMNAYVDWYVISCLLLSWWEGDKSVVFTLCDTAPRWSNAGPQCVLI